MLTLDDHWVWDFWLADDGELFHIFFLHAPRSLGNEARRHRAARIGHAVSADLVDWDLRHDPFTVGEPGSFDATATWTGNILQGPDGTWRMFYTGSRFLADEPDVANIETIGVATSPDLSVWTKQPGPISIADSRWYETWGTSSWKEEAWRDPWVYADPAGDGFHMLITARADHGAIDDRGVVGHAQSADLITWETTPPLSRPGAGFAHAEVFQLVAVEETWVLLFSCSTDALSSARASEFPDVGTWALVVDDPAGPFDLTLARPLTTESLYSGRVVQQRDGRWAFLAFHNVRSGGEFRSAVSDPIPFTIGADGWPVVHQTHEAHA